MANSTRFRFSSPASDRRDRTRADFRASRRPRERVALMGQRVDLVKRGHGKISPLSET